MDVQAISHLDGQDDDRGWQTVTCVKRNRKRSSSKKPSECVDDDDGDQHNRPRAVKEAQKAGATAEAPVPRLKIRYYPSYSSYIKEYSVTYLNCKVHASELRAFLDDLDASYESTTEHIQLIRLANFIHRRRSAYLPKAVQKISYDWISQRSFKALVSFIFWTIDTTLTASATMEPTKGFQIFMVVEMILERHPDVLISALSKLGENPNYNEDDAVFLIIVYIHMAIDGDLVVGMYSWIYYLLPIVSKSTCAPHCRGWILQLLESILSTPKARTILFNGVVRKGKLLVPPSALEQLLRVTFPAPSARIADTERFEAVYPTLKELALSGARGRKSIKQASWKILSFAVQAVCSGIPELSKETTDIFIWCLTQNPDCYKQWDMIYLDNIEASVAVLRMLSDQWKEHSVKYSSLDPLRDTLKSFRQKNAIALANRDYAGHQAFIRDADKYCQVILERLSRGQRCVGSMFVGGTLAVSVLFWALKKLFAMSDSPQSF